MTELSLKDLEGRDVTLASIAGGKPTLFIFVRFKTEASKALSG